MQNNKQIELRPFRVDKKIEHNGIEMGVLENGVPFLSGGGLARMCGIGKTTLHDMSANWSIEKSKPRGELIQRLLQARGYQGSELFLKSEYKGVVVNAYTEPVCLALLEYYAFEAEDRREGALRAYRTLARESFRQFVYLSVGYTLEQSKLESWRHFHDRLDITTDATPRGYFSIFREIASMIVPMIRAGVVISDKLVPDISVGIAWSKHWQVNDLSSKHGDRVQYDHNYPSYYPQAASNPQKPYAYPNEALADFREWLESTYVLSKFPRYLSKKLPKNEAGKILDAINPKQITPPASP